MLISVPQPNFKVSMVSDHRSDVIKTTKQERCEMMGMLTDLTAGIICNIRSYRNVALYTLNLHNVICQLYLSEAGGKRKE